MILLLVFVCLLLHLAGAREVKVLKFEYMVTGLKECFAWNLNMVTVLVWEKGKVFASLKGCLKRQLPRTLSSNPTGAFYIYISSNTTGALYVTMHQKARQVTASFAVPQKHIAQCHKLQWSLRIASIVVNRTKNQLVQLITYVTPPSQEGSHETMIRQPL